MSRRTSFRLLVALTVIWAAWTGWSLLGQSTPYTLVVIDDAGVPISGAVIDIDGSQAGTSDESGLIAMEWNRSSQELEVSAPGHIARMVSLNENPGEEYSVVLNARVLRGRVLDPEDQPIAAVEVRSGEAAALTDSEGHYSLRGAEPGPVVATRPAWVSTEFVWDGGVGDEVVILEPFSARAVHLSGDAVSTQLPAFLEMAATTELNALMIDLKDETGYIWYNSDDPTAREVGAISSVYNLEDVIAQAHAADLYVIGRLVAFQDPVAAIAKTSMAVWDSDLNQPYRANGQYFLDPTDPDARAYAMALAVEACAAGLDEIQFDYVRFPDARRESAQFDGGVGAEVRIATVTDFLKEAVAMLRPMGCAVAADIFGFITTAADDGGIGQKWEELTAVVDVASPMLYPSHYGTGWFGHDNPNEHPGDVVTRALEDAMERNSTNLVIRPWLQDFGYSTESVRSQIDSVEAFGLGWMLWNAKSIVTVDALGIE